MPTASVAQETLALGSQVYMYDTYDGRRMRKRHRRDISEDFTSNGSNDILQRNEILKTQAKKKKKKKKT